MTKHGNIDKGTKLGAGTTALTLAFRGLHRSISTAAWVARTIGIAIAASVRLIASIDRRIRAVIGPPICALRAWCGRVCASLADRFATLAKRFERSLHVLWLGFCVLFTGAWLVLAGIAVVRAVSKANVGHILRVALELAGLTVAIVAVAFALVLGAPRVLRVIGRRIGPAVARLLARTRHSISVARGRAAAPVALSVAASELTELPAGGSGLWFELTAHQSPYLSPGSREVDAIIAVAATASDDRAGEPERAEVILLDCSGSMAYPMAKLDAAKAAAAAALDAMPDGSWFAIVRGSHFASPVYPAAGLAQAAPSTRADAKRALKRQYAEGGTALGEWLSLAGALFATRPAAIAHAILLTDGRDESEARSELDAALAAARGAFQCDCRGIGTDWSVAELRSIAQALRGGVDIVAEPAALAADFAEMTRTAMARTCRDVTLELWTPRGATLTGLRQVSPEIVDLTPSASGAQRTSYATGAWGDETREYHVRIAVPEGEAGDEMLAARVSVAGAEADAASITAIWTEDPQLAAMIDPVVAHYTGCEQLAEAIQAGLRAIADGDDDAAAAMLERAIAIASTAGETETLDLLNAIVEEIDGAAGTVRLRKDAPAQTMMTLDTRSTKTTQRVTVG
jgi:hypothetical protein